MASIVSHLLFIAHTAKRFETLSNNFFGIFLFFTSLDIAPTLTLNLQAITFVREVGHNGNIRNDNCDLGEQYIMCPAVNPSVDGWSPVSITSLYDKITSSSCANSVPIICTDDMQCDDGNACNGYETCDLPTGKCEAGTLVDCDSGGEFSL